MAKHIYESYQEGMIEFAFEYEDTYSKGHTCRCGGQFKSLQDAIDFFGFEKDPDIISWKRIDANEKINEDHFRAVDYSQAMRDGSIKVGTFDNPEQMIKLRNILMDKYDISLHIGDIDDNGDVYIDKDEAEDVEDIRTAALEAADMYDRHWEAASKDYRFKTFVGLFDEFKPCSETGKKWFEYQKAFFTIMAI